MCTDQAMCQGHPEVGRKKARKEEQRMLSIYGNEAVCGVALEDCVPYVRVYILASTKSFLYTQV